VEIAQGPRRATVEVRQPPAGREAGSYSLYAATILEGAEFHVFKAVAGLLFLRSIPAPALPGSSIPKTRLVTPSGRREFNGAIVGEIEIVAEFG
jgi:hypothetical protein